MHIRTRNQAVPHAMLICLLVILLPACIHKSQLVKKTVYSTACPRELPVPEPDECQRPDHTLTVWIHGTKFGLDELYKNVFDAQPGLRHVHALPQHHPLTMRIKALADQCADFFPYESVYCFCWSGKLRSVEREKTALVLHQTLAALINEYQEKHGLKPAIRLVCHSHGANVALNLARVNAQQEEKIVIDSLILFACPVQCETRDFVRDATFKRIYSMYSPLDWVQVVAPQWTCRTYNKDGCMVTCKQKWLPLSERRFSRSPSLHQAWVKRNGIALSHSDFTSHSFLRLLPQLLDAMDEAYAADTALGECCKELLLHIKRSD
jgi:hypothetical protein